MKPGKKRKLAGAEEKPSSNATDENAENAGDHESETPIDYPLAESLNIDTQFCSR